MVTEVLQWTKKKFFLIIIQYPSDYCTRCAQRLGEVSKLIFNSNRFTAQLIGSFCCRLKRTVRASPQLKNSSNYERLAFVLLPFNVITALGPYWIAHSFNFLRLTPSRPPEHDFYEFSPLSLSNERNFIARTRR